MHRGHKLTRYTKKICILISTKTILTYILYYKNMQLFHNIINIKNIDI